MGTSERTCNLLYRLAQSKAGSLSPLVKTKSISVMHGAAAGNLVAGTGGATSEDAELGSDVSKHARSRQSLFADDVPLVSPLTTPSMQSRPRSSSRPVSIESITSF